MPFFVVVSSVLAQAWLQPFAKANDNVLELATLTMLLCVLYGDVALNAEAMGVPETHGAGLSAIVTIGAALFIAVVLLLASIVIAFSPAAPNFRVLPGPFIFIPALRPKVLIVSP